MDVKYILMFAALILSFIAVLVTGPIMIPWLRKLKIGQNIREDGPAWHKSKQGVPTMGGLMFVFSITLITVALCWESMYEGDMSVLSMVLMPLFYAGIGYMDDYTKVIKKRNLGLTGRQKILLQTIVASGFLFSMFFSGNRETYMKIPFTPITIEMGWFYYIAGAFIIVGFVNAVNLTDGLDGLAASVTGINALAYAAIGGLAAGGAVSSTMSSSAAIYACAVAGGLAGFLVYNFYPAKVIMGDTGSLFLGGVITSLAFALKIPLILPILGFVHLAEAGSVMLQVGYFKATNGKRLFKMSPIHHHFEMCGWKEKKIVFAFSAIALVCAAVSVAAVWFN